MSYNQFAQDTQQQQQDENQPISQVENLASLDALLQQSDTTQGQQQQRAGAGEGEDLVERAILMQEQQDAEAEEIDRLNRFDVDAAFDEDDNENRHDGRSTTNNNQQHVGQDGEHVIAPTHRSNGIIVDFGRNDQMNDEIDVDDDDDDADHDENEDDTNNEVEIVDADDAAVSSPKSKRGKKAKSSNADGNSNKLTTDAALPTGEPRVWSPAFHETVLRKLLSVATEGAEKQNQQQQQQNKNNNKSKSKFQQQRNNAKPPEPLNFSRDALRAINCSVELILKDLANECVKVARRRGLKTINYDIVADICTRVDRFSFLSDVIPTPPMGMMGGNRVVSSKKTRAAATATTQE